MLRLFSSDLLFARQAIQERKLLGIVCYLKEKNQETRFNQQLTTAFTAAANKLNNRRIKNKQMDYTGEKEKHKSSIGVCPTFSPYGRNSSVYSRRVPISHSIDYLKEK